MVPGRGKAPEREWSEAGREKLAALAATQSLDPGDALTLLGESCVDVYLNGEAHGRLCPSTYGITLSAVTECLKSG